jgi:hypothetical protein
LTDEATEPPGAEVIPLREPGDDSDIVERGPLDWLEAEISTSMARGDLLEAERLIKDLRARTAPGHRVELLEADGIFAPLPATEWVVQALEIAPGPPTVVAGYGYSGKTVCLQALAIELAAGRRIWGEHLVERGRVVHLDWEQGDNLTRRRYQRLARALELEPGDLQGWLATKSFPDLYLDQEGTEAELCRLFEGAKLAIHDSLRAAAPSIDENSSDARKVLDTLARVSERTGCAQAAILHARKAQKDSPGGRAQSIRGSGGLFDAAQSAWVFEGENQPGKNTTYAHHVKARLTGVKRESFAMQIEDVPWQEDPQWGLRVRVVDLESYQRCQADDAAKQLSEAVLAFVRENPDCSSREIRNGVKGANPSIEAARDRLVRLGKLEDLGDRKGSKWRVRA